MFKTVTFPRRRADPTREEFVRRYEAGHAWLGERLLRRAAIRYIRRYPVPNPETGVAGVPGHDVLMEIWYPDRSAREATIARLGAPETMAEIVADEETLFDRSANRFFLVEECGSELA